MKLFVAGLITGALLVGAVLGVLFGRADFRRSDRKSPGTLPQQFNEIAQHRLTTSAAPVSASSQQPQPAEILPPLESVGISAAASRLPDLRPAPSFKLAQAGGLQISPDKQRQGALRFVRGLDSYLFTPETGYCFDDPVVQRDGHAAYFIVRKYEVMTKGSELRGIGMEYYCLAKFEIPPPPTPLSKIRRQFLLRKENLQALLGGKRCWVESLFEVSKDEERLLLTVASEDASHAPDFTQYPRKPYWYFPRSNNLAIVGTE